MTQWPSKVRRRNLHGQHMLCVRSEMWAQGLQRDLLKCMPFALFGSLSGTGYLVFAVRNGWHQRSFMWANLATVSKWHEITFEFLTWRTISIFDIWRDSLTTLIGKEWHDHNFSVKHSMQRCGGQGWYGLLVGFMSNSPNFHFRWVWMSECSNCADQNVHDTNSTDSPRLQLLCRRSYVRLGQRPLFSMLATCRLQWKKQIKWISTRHVSLFHSLASVQCHNVCSSTLRKSVRRLPGSLLEEMCTSEL